MNILKNMEAIFVVMLAAAGLGSAALDHLPQAQAQAKPQAAVERNIATPTSMAVVVIRAPRAQGGR